MTTWLAVGGSSTSSDITSILLNLGLPGVLLLVGAVVIRYLYQQRERAWAAERQTMLDAVGRADTRAKDAEASRDKAIDSLKDFMEIAQTQTMTALSESQKALSDAVTRERVLVDRIGNLERELTLTRQGK